MFLPTITQTIETGNPCGPAITHSLAEMSEVLLQDIQSLTADDNCPFSTGWGVKAADDQWEVSKCIKSHEEKASRQYHLLLQIASLSPFQPPNCMIIYPYRCHWKTFCSLVFPKGWKDKKGERKRRRVLCTHYNCTDLLLRAAAAKHPEFHEKIWFSETQARSQLIKISIKNTILTSVWTFTYLTAPRHYWLSLSANL